MRIYFAGSIRGGRDDIAIYMKLIERIQRHGEVLTEHVSCAGKEELPESDVYARDFGWLRSADVVVAEVTTPSLGVGFEIGTAQSWGVPVLCLFRHGARRKLSAMLAGNPDVRVAEYAALDEALTAIDEFVASVKA
jgi:nucleoside 2-deoxyribosyltransferase